MERFDEYEDISSRSDNFNDDEFEDIDSGRYNYEDDYDYIDGPGISMSKQAKLDADREIASKQQARQSGGIRMRQPVEMDERAEERARARRQAVQSRKNAAPEMEDISSKKKHHKHISLRMKILRAIGICFLIFVLLIAILIYTVYSKLSTADAGEEHVNPYISESELYSDKDVYNLLLLGVDAREGETVSRSDTMMLVSIDKANKKIKVTSFLRDSYVEIPDYGWTKLNTACSQGGVDLVWNTIEYNFKIKLDNYMMVDFVAFEDLIDVIGGVDVEVTEAEANYLNNTWYEWTLTGNELHFDSGESVHLDGEQALMFCRIRKLDSDFMRTERQRRTIAAVKSELVKTSPIELIRLSNTVLPNVTTDISSSKMLSLGAGAIFSYLKYDIESFAIPADGTWSNATKACGACLVFDVDENADILYNYIYRDINPNADEGSN